MPKASVQGTRMHRNGWRGKPMSFRKSFLWAGGLAVALLCGAASVPSFAESGSDQIAEEAKNPNLWPAPGRDLALTRHSPLSDINTGNIDKLQLAWSQS